MAYKKKITVLSGIVAALAVVYLMTFVFDPARAGSRSDMHTWLEAGDRDRIDGITIHAAGETIDLILRQGAWLVSWNGRNFPARQTLVEDLIEALARRAVYPVRSTSASSHERYLLTDEDSIQITVRGGMGPPLLSLMLGQLDITGRDIYMRRRGENEVRSGADIFSTFIMSHHTSWYNLRLFPESETGSINETDVQRLTVYPPDSPSPLIFTRSGRGWAFNFNLADPDTGSVENYIRGILNTAGDAFTDDIEPADPMFDHGRLVLEFGDGTMRTVRVGPPMEGGRYYATVSGSDLVYAIPEWGARFFVDPESFER